MFFFNYSLILPACNVSIGRPFPSYFSKFLQEGSLFPITHNFGDHPTNKPLKAFPPSYRIYFYCIYLSIFAVCITASSAAH